MNRTLKRGLTIAAFILGGSSIFSLDLEKTNHPRTLIPSDFENVRWLPYEGNEQNRPVREFFLYEDVPHTIQNENAYVRAVTQTHYQNPDLANHYPDLDYSRSVAPTKDF